MQTKYRVRQVQNFGLHRVGDTEKPNSLVLAFGGKLHVTALK